MSNQVNYNNYTVYDDAPGRTESNDYIKCQCPEGSNHKHGDKNPSFIAYKNSTFGYCLSCGFTIQNKLYAIRYNNVPASFIFGYDRTYTIAYEVGKTIEKWAKKSLLEIDKTHIVYRYLESRGIDRKYWEYLDIGCFGELGDLIDDLSRIDDITPEIVGQIVNSPTMNIARLAEYPLLTFFKNAEDLAVLSIKGRRIHEKFCIEYRGKTIPDKFYNEHLQYQGMAKRITYSVMNKLYAIIEGKAPLKPYSQGCFGINDVYTHYKNVGRRLSCGVLEGEFDVLSPKVKYFKEMEKQGMPLFEANALYGTPIIAIGTATSNFDALTPLETKVGRFVLAFDNDSAGRIGRLKCGRVTKRTDVSFVSVPSDCKDVDDMVNRYGYKHLQNMLNDAKPIVDLFYDNLLLELDNAGIEVQIEDKQEMVKKSQLVLAREIAAKEISLVENETTAGQLIRDVYKLLRYSEISSLEIAVNKIRKSFNNIDFGVIEEDRITYSITKGREKEIIKKVIANFIIHIVNNIKGSDGSIRREIILEHQKGEQHRVIVDAEAMSQVGKFKKVIANIGEYIFLGAENDLQKIWAYKSQYSSPSLIYEPNQIGTILEHNTFLFSDAAISASGKIHFPDNVKNIIWVDKMTGIRPRKNGDMELPSLGYEELREFFDNGEANVKKIQEYAQTIPQLIYESFNGGKAGRGDYESLLAVGWIAACIYDKEIMNELGFFPFLFLIGQMGSGKTSFGKSIKSMFGMKEEGIMLTSSTPVSIARTVNYFSSVPVWYDEFKKTKSVDELIPFFKSLYNRQMITKGVANATNDVISATANAPVVLSGEMAPTDKAMSSRCIYVHFSKEKRGSDDLYQKLVGQTPLLRLFIVNLLINKNKNTSKTIIEKIKSLRSEFIALGVESRTAETHALVLGTYVSLFDYKKEEVTKWMRTMIIDGRREVSESIDEIASFFTDIGTVVRFTQAHEIGNLENMAKFTSDSDGQERYMILNMDSAHYLWTLHCRRIGKETLSRKDFAIYLQHKQFLVRDDKGSIEYFQDLGTMIKPERREAIKLDLWHKDLPTTVQSFVNEYKEKVLKENY